MGEADQIRLYLTMHKAFELLWELEGAPFGNEGILGKPYEAKSDGALIHHLRQGDDGVATHVYVLRYMPTCQPACSLGHMPTC